VRSALACVLLAGVLGGCGLSVSGPSTSSSSTASPVARADTTHEYTSGRAPTEHASRPSFTPVEAIRLFADAYINWDAGTIVTHLRVLAAASVGQARSAMTLAAGRVAGDYELRRGGITNEGTVEAISALASGHHQYVVVTREQTSSTNSSAYQGIAPAWHVTLATVTEFRPGLWVVSGWQPET
jgi:hypothetical protein